MLAIPERHALCKRQDITCIFQNKNDRVTPADNTVTVVKKEIP